MIVDPEIRDLEVPCPDHWQFKHPSKRADVRKVQWATARALAEQDVWRHRLDALRQLNLPCDAINCMDEFDTDTLLQEMGAAGAIYPPTWKDEQAWFERQGREWHWSQSMKHRRCAKIQDKALRSGLYHLLGISQHKERIKALVLFASIFKVDPDSDETYLMFTFWKVLHIYEILKGEYGDTPNSL